MAGLSSPYFLTRQNSAAFRTVAAAALCTALASTAALGLSGCSSKSEGAPVSQSAAQSSALSTASPFEAASPNLAAVQILLGDANQAFATHDWETAILDYSALSQLDLPQGFLRSRGLDAFAARQIARCKLYEGLAEKSQGEYNFAMEDFGAALADQATARPAYKMLCQVTDEANAQARLMYSGSEPIQQDGGGAESTETNGLDPTTNALNSAVANPSSSLNGSESPDQEQASSEFNNAASDVATLDSNLQMQSVNPLFFSGGTDSQGYLFVTSDLSRMESDRQTMLQAMPDLGTSITGATAQATLDEVDGYISDVKGMRTQAREHVDSPDALDGAWSASGFAG